MNSLRVTIDQSQFSGLNAVNGGAIYITENSNGVYAQNNILSSKNNFYKLSLTNLTIENCSATLNGGAIFMKESSEAQIYNSVISGTSNLNGGGIYFWCTPSSTSDQIFNPKLATKCSLDL